jgi:hypothetical protein
MDTLADSTPGTFLSAFSTLVAQLAHSIPPTESFKVVIRYSPGEFYYVIKAGKRSKISLICLASKPRETAMAIAGARH